MKQNLHGNARTMKANPSSTTARSNAPEGLWDQRNNGNQVAQARLDARWNLHTVTEGCSATDHPPTCPNKPRQVWLGGGIRHW